MRDHNVMLGFPNRIAECSITGGEWVLPIANVQDDLLTVLARSAGLGLTQATFDLDTGRPRPIRLLAFVNHNLSVTARIRVQASDTNDFAALVLDETFDAFGSVVNGDWNIDELEWENDNFWYGAYNAEDLEGFTAIAQHILSAGIVAQFWRFTIEDPDNTDGFVEFGRVFFGPAIQPRINYNWGASTGYESATVVQTSLGGVEFYDVRENLRIFRFTLQHMGDDEAFGTFLEIVRRAGIHAEIMVIPDPTDDRNGPRRNFLGRLRQLSPLEQLTWMNGGSAHSMAFELKERR